MKHRIKKFVLWLIAVAALLANTLLLIRGLSKKETDSKRDNTRNPFLAGTAIASILAILALLRKWNRESAEPASWYGRCPVCDVRLVSRGRYCSECGSRV